MKKSNQRPERDPNNECFFILYPHEYGYRYNIRNETILEYYRQYTIDNKLCYCGVSHADRLAFEAEMDKKLFPHGLPQDEVNRRNIFFTILPALQAATIRERGWL